MLSPYLIESYRGSFASRACSAASGLDTSSCHGFIASPRQVQIVSQVPRNHRTGFKMRFWEREVNTSHWLSSFTSRREDSVLAVCDAVSGLKLILSYKYACLILIFWRSEGLHLFVPSLAAWGREVSLSRSLSCLAGRSGSPVHTPA